MRQEQSERLATSIVEFCCFLRTHGLSNDLSQTLTALEAAKTIGGKDRTPLAFALRSALCSTREEWDLFPQLFETFWDKSHARRRSASGEYKGPSQGNGREARRQRLNGLPRAIQ